MKKQIRAMMIGAHPDDCDFRCGGLALKYAQAGHKVKFLAMCDGSGGHHIMEPAEIAARRRGETQEVARIAGIEYDVWNVTDCELMADLETRKRLVREIRKFNPDIIFCSRPNDYHADHRNTAQLVQDASFLLTVPCICADTPYMEHMPVVLYWHDSFKKPYPCQPDVIVPIDDTLDVFGDVGDVDPASELIERENAAELSRRISEHLSEYENRVWWLYFSGLSSAQIARVVGRSPKSVGNALCRIRQKLRALLS